MPAMNAAGKTTMNVIAHHDRMLPANPMWPSGRMRFATIAIRSPSANGKMIASASSVQVSAKPPIVARDSPPRSAYAAPPAPMPRSAMARINPNMNVVPPRSGASIRYQTSSINKNAKPATDAATKTKRANGAPASAGSGAVDKERARPAEASAPFDCALAMTSAVTPTTTFTPTAMNSAARFPNASSR